MCLDLPPTRNTLTAPIGKDFVIARIRWTCVSETQVVQSTLPRSTFRCKPMILHNEELPRGMRTRTCRMARRVHALGELRLATCPANTRARTRKTAPHALGCCRYPSQRNRGVVHAPARNPVRTRGRYSTNRPAIGTLRTNGRSV